MFISSCNQLAYHFVQTYDLAKSPAITIIYGQPGMGKTALLSCLYDRVLQETKQVILIDAGKFSSKYSFAAQAGYLTSFRKDIRSNKLALVDNINAIKGKKKSIEELFHTLETIITQGGKAVITYRGTTPAYDYLGDRFASRLKASLAIAISEPDLTEKKNFMTHYLQSRPIQDVLSRQIFPPAELAPSALQEVIRDSRNFRELTDYIHRVLQISGKACVSAGTACRTGPLAHLKNDDIGQITAILLPHLCAHYDVAESLVRGGAKRKSAVEARYMLYLLLNELFGYSYTEIAKAYGKNTRILVNNCIVLKATRQEGFETLCQKLYNQLKTCKNSKEI